MNNDFNSKYRQAVIEWLGHKDKNKYLLVDKIVHDMVQLEIRPTNVHACPILIASKNGSTQICLGKGIAFDETDGLYASDGSILTTELSPAKFCNILEAVWNGSVVEKFCLKQTEIMKSEGSINISSNVYKTSTQILFRIGKCTEVKEITYQAY